MSNSNQVAAQSEIVGVHADYSRMKEVIMYFPESSLGRLEPKNIREGKDYLLVDDILWPEEAKKEHEMFCKVMKAAGIKVLYLEDLLVDVLNIPKAKQAILSKLALLESHLPSDNRELADVLFSGEYNGRVFFHPAPNALFTRDLMAVVKESIVLSYGAFFEAKEGEEPLTVPRPRAREMMLMRYIVRYHEIFAHTHIIDINENYDEELSCEGGDILVLKDIVLVGASERTNMEAIRRSAPHFFEQGIKHVFAVNLPKERGSMHLDTVFTTLSSDAVMIYPEVTRSTDMFITVLSPDGKERPYRAPLMDVLSKYLDVSDVSIFRCGGDDELVAAREQWSDGANMLALKPNWLVGYKRNTGTAQTLKDQGYKVVNAEEFCSNTAVYRDEPKLLILIPGGELSRARGGPRCLTLPIVRTQD